MTWPRIRFPSTSAGLQEGGLLVELVPVEAMDRIRRAAALLAHATEFGGAALSAWETLPDEVKP